MTSGHLYFATDADGITTVTVALAAPSPSNLALLKAGLVQRGFRSAAFRGSTVIVAVGQRGIAGALDAIGSALGGLRYRLVLSGYQGQTVSGDGVESERLTFEVTGPIALATEDIGNLYGANDGDDTECG